MSRDKQIEEMANAYYEAMLKARVTLGSMNEGAPKWYAKELYNAGYRKASEVASEIIDEIIRYIDTHKDFIAPIPTQNLIEFGEFLGELEKKCTKQE